MKKYEIETTFSLCFLFLFMVLDAFCDYHFMFIKKMDMCVCLDSWA